MAGRGNSLLGDLSVAANRLVADNAHKLARIAGEGLTLEQRAQRPWDISAKKEIAERIAAEEDRRAWTTGQGRPHNDARDAMRHARWSQRTAQAAGPIFAEVAGIAHEVDNLVDSVRRHRRIIGPYERAGQPGMPPTPGETVIESRMDLHNNAEGRRAAREGRQIDPSKLQARPGAPLVKALYRGR